MNVEKEAKRLKIPALLVVFEVFWGVLGVKKAVLGGMGGKKGVYVGNKYNIISLLKELRQQRGEGWG